MYYIVDKNTRVTVRVSATPFNRDEAVQPPDPYVQLRRVDDDVQPGYDPATQKLVRNFIDDDDARTRTFRWAVAALSQAEINAYQQKQQDAAQLAIIKNTYNDLINGTGTAAERLVRCERALAWLLRQHVRNQ